MVKAVGSKGKRLKDVYFALHTFVLPGRTGIYRYVVKYTTVKYQTLILYVIVVQCSESLSFIENCCEIVGIKTSYGQKFCK